MNNMQSLKLKDKSNALVVVAHPDDETIWMGGTILKNPEVNWTIFSLCRIHDKDRAPKFFKVCKYLKAKGLMSNLEDDGKLGIKASGPMVNRLINQKIKLNKYNYFFTHGANGEYGHPRHQGVHRGLTELVIINNPRAISGRSKLSTGQLLCFNYKMAGGNKLAFKKDSDFITKLTAAEFKKKYKIMTDIYGFDADGIDAGYCTQVEGFKHANI